MVTSAMRVLSELPSDGWTSAYVAGGISRLVSLLNDGDQLHPFSGNRAVLRGRRGLGHK